MAMIEIEDLVKVYEQGDVRAVDGVSLEVGEGEIFGFLGPNGAGKTTCVKIMTTLLRLTSGRVEVAGHDPTVEPAEVRRRIGVALQEAGLDPLSTGREFLLLQCELYGLDAPDRRTDELLEVVGLQDAADRRIDGYSGGMRRRLDLAGALVHQPQVLFLDEPTTGLDPASRKSVWAEVRRLNEAGTTIFLTTQYLEEADALAGRLAIIDRGRIVARGSPEQLKARIGEDVLSVSVDANARDKAVTLLEQLEGVHRVEPEGRSINAYMREGSSLVAAVVRSFDDAGVDVGRIALRQPTLDDVFLDATGHRLEGAAADRPAADTEATP